MEYYKSASRQYRSQNVWLKRCCLGVAVCTAFVLTVSLLSTPSSGVRSSRLVKFNETETEYTPGVFDRLTGNVRAFSTAWSLGCKRCMAHEHIAHWQSSSTTPETLCLCLVF